MACRSRGATWGGNGATRCAGTLLPGILVLCAWACCAPRAASATPATTSTYYAPHLGFKIPFTIDPSERRIRDVQLYARDGDGPWEQVATARPGEENFQFTAQHDGWYAFTVRTVDTDGHGYPATLDQVQPRLKVCVDTQPPAVTLRPAATPAGPADVEWEVRDENLDVESLHLDYRTQGGADWRPLGVPRVASGHRAWNPETNAPVEVRLQVKDLAGNASEATTVVNPATAPHGPSASPTGTGTPGTGEHTTATAEAGPNPTSVRIVNTKRISINYEIKEVGKSGIAAVELWFTRNEGRNWQKYDERTTPQPPYTVEVSEEGLYGFTLVARNRAGFGQQPPRVGDAPQVWVEVDLTKPVVRLVAVEVGRGPETGNLTITYTATDKNLTAQPIALSYAEKPDGSWTPIAANQENSGRYVWRMPEDVPYQFYVRVEATDKAGNAGSAETAKPVLVDLSQPKVQVIGISGNP